MKTEQAVKIIQQRYELDLSPYEVKFLKGVINAVATIKKKVIIKQTDPQIKDIGQVFKDICTLHNLHPHIVKSYEKIRKRKAEYIKCRVHFVRYCYLNNLGFTTVQLAEFLNSDHSTIIYYRDQSKVDCPIPPFNFKMKK